MKRRGHFSDHGMNLNARFCTEMRAYAEMIKQAQLNFRRYPTSDYPKS